MDNIIFIAGSRDISGKRLLQLFLKYRAKGKIIWGVYKEEFVSGFFGQPQFRTLNFAKLKNFYELVKNKYGPSKEYFEIIEYAQDDEIQILSKINPRKAIFINGSWKLAFQRRAIYDFLNKNNIKFSLKSPFESEKEARSYEKNILPKVEEFVEGKIKTLIDKRSFKRSLRHNFYLDVADAVAMQSFDYTWQTGAVLVRNEEILLKGYNKILPFETYAMLHGSLREKNLSGLNDLNNYDTLHAEMDIVSQALQKKLSMKGSTLYVSLMPCPNCAKMLATTGISKIVCRREHYGGYARNLLESMNIEVICLDH